MDHVHLSQFYIIKKQTVLSSNVSFRFEQFNFRVAHLVFKLLFREFEDVSMKMWFCLSESSRGFQISKEKIQYLTNRNVVIQAWLDRGIK